MDNFSMGEEISIHIGTGIDIKAKAWGRESSKHKMLALHGWLDNANSFDFIAPILAEKGIRIIAMDFIGHGLSPHKPSWCNIYYTDYITQVLDVTEALQWKRFSIMGHSMGAGIATLFAASMPHLVERIICFDFIGILSREQDQIKAIQYAMQSRSVINNRKPNLYNNKQAIFDKLKSNNPWIKDEAAHKLLERSIEAVVSNTSGEVMYKLRHDPRLVGPSIFIMREIEVLITLEQIECPVFIIWGTTSAQQFQIKKNWTSIMEERMKKIRNLKQMVVAGSHHFHMECTDAFYKDILEFMFDENEISFNPPDSSSSSSSSTTSPPKIDNHNQIAEQDLSTSNTSSPIIPPKSNLYKYIISDE